MKRRWLRPCLWTLAGFVPGLALAVGVAIGVLSSGSRFDEPTFRGMPVRAMGANSGESFALTTGSVDGETEAIIAIDYLTGDLYAWIYYPRSGGFGAAYKTNVTADVMSEQGKTPSYVIVTGQTDVRGVGGQAAFANCIVYVADSNTGNIAAYAIPYNRTAAASGAPQQSTFQLLGQFKGRNAAIRK